MAEDEMVRWYHLIDGNEFEQAPGDGEGQGSLSCCTPWVLKELDQTQGLNKTYIPNQPQVNIRILMSCYFLPEITSLKNYYCCLTGEQFSSTTPF